MRKGEQTRQETAVVAQPHLEFLIVRLWIRLALALEKEQLALRHDCASSTLELRFAGGTNCNSQYNAE